MAKSFSLKSGNGYSRRGVSAYRLKKDGGGFTTNLAKLFGDNKAVFFIRYDDWFCVGLFIDQKGGALDQGIFA
jgi:hypothetical protein